MTLSEKYAKVFEKNKRKKEEKRKKQIQKWHEAGVKARKKNKEERDKLRKKRPVGRPKKRGPKKKKKYIRKKVYKERPRWDFKIVGVTNGKQNEFIGHYHNSAEAYEEFERLSEANNSVVFDRKMINNGVLKDSVDEYLMLEKDRNGDKDNTMLRNEYGKLVEQKTNSKKWVVFDKMERKVEETFWVYGHDPRCDRKTFMWIFDNIINVFEGEYDMKRVLIFKNKIILKKDDGDMDLIICKNTTDSIRFYNMAEEMLKKSKRFVFIGCFDKVSDRRRALEVEIAEKTGWDKRKIQSVSTRA